MENKLLNEEGIRLYLQMMQDNVNRMAANSANAKAWLYDWNCWIGF